MPVPLPAGAPQQARFALDVQGLDELRRSARASPGAALPQVARQFEALFIGMLIKGMREATPSSGLLDGDSGGLYRSMLDQQLAQHLSARGIGIGDALLAQLRRTLPADAAAAPGPRRLTPPSSGMPGPGVGDPAPSAVVQSAPVRTPRAWPAQLAPLAVAEAPAKALPAVDADGVAGAVRAFVARLGDAAREAAAACGLPHTLILAQAALESGWGRREVRGDDGTPSHNLFGIKADRSWHGPVVQATTTEVVDGVARRVRADFRAYGSYAEAFTDYAKFLLGNPRYAGALAQAEPAHAARALQQAGYATDPDYAAKLVRVMERFVEQGNAPPP